MAPSEIMERACLFVVALVLVAAPAVAQEASPRSVVIQVVSTPSRANVEVLGRGEVGRTPIRRLELPAGEYDFVFTRRGHARSVVHVLVREDGQTVGTELQRAGRIAVLAEHLPARGASIRLDGELVGRVPQTLQVAPGRRLVEVEADGFLTFAQWVEVEAGRARRVPVRLEERPPDVGSILVTSDVSRAQVMVDGQARGRTPVLVQGLSPGPHTVAVIGPDEARVEHTVDVRANAREVLGVELLRLPEPPGAVAVTTQPTGATVVVDGENRGVTPLELVQLSPGVHRFEISLDGYDPEQRVVTVRGGERQELHLTLQTGQPRPGRIMVSAAGSEDAFVILDGVSRGRAPITLDQVPPGTHTVRVQAEGAAPVETDCVIRFGETCTVEAELLPPPIAVTVRARHGGALVPDATLYLDGVEEGSLPWEGELEPGTYALEIRADGYEPYTRALVLRAGDEGQTISASMEPAGPPTAEEPGHDTPEEESAPSRDERPRFYAREGAEPLPAEHGSLDLSLGWPYLLGIGLDVGLPGPVDLGVATRTFGRVTEIEVRSRLGWSPADVLGLGLWVRLVAGLGPDEVDTFGAKIDGRVSLRPFEDVVVTAWLGLDLSTDDYPFREQDSARLAGEVQRQNLARARLGGATAWRFYQAWSVHLRLEGILASTGGRRRLYGDVLGLGNSDTEVYGELGAGYAW